MAPKPLVFVPGLPGSKLIDNQAGGQELFPSLAALTSTTLRPTLIRRLSGPDDPDQDDGMVAGEPIRSILFRSSLIDFSGTLKQADTLYAILQDLGYPAAAFEPPYPDRFKAVGWDWRRPVDQRLAQAALAGAIRDLRQATGEPVTVLCHSTGGLVVRALLESQPDLCDLIERLIAIAIPWAGTLQSLPQLLGQVGFGPIDAAETAQIVGHSWAAFDVLPPGPPQTPMQDGEGDLDLFTVAGHQASTLVDTGWIPPGIEGDPLRLRAASANRRLGTRQRTLDLGGRNLEVLNLVGWGTSTLTNADLQSAGNVILNETTEGDGTIPRRSAAWLEGPGVTTFLLPIGHYEDRQLESVHIVIWQNRPVRDLLAFFLAGQPRPPYTYAAVDAADAVGVDLPIVRVRLVALDMAGRPLPNAYALAVGLNPPSPAQYLLDDDGRGTMRIAREHIPVVQAGLGRFGVEIHWQEAGQDRHSPAQFMIVQKH
jgi:hypothetical protein